MVLVNTASITISDVPREGLARRTALSLPIGLSTVTFVLNIIDVAIRK